MTTNNDCLFCSFATGEGGTEIIGENEHAVAFRDINPQAPLHVLVIPRQHYSDVATLASQNPAALSALIALANKIAAQEADGQYRLIFNSGPQAGQSVFHVHGHVIGGTKLGWNPA